MADSEEAPIGAPAAPAEGEEEAGAAAAAAAPEKDALASWRGLWEAERGELLRSQRVQQQLLQVLPSLRQRRDDLQFACQQLRARVGPELQGRLQHLEAEVEEMEQARQAAGPAACELAEARECLEQEHRACVRAAEESRREEAAARASTEELLAEQLHAEARRDEALARGRSMVAAEVLERVVGETSRLRAQVQEQQAEASRLREALADAWAARGDPSEQSALPQGCDQLEGLDNIEEQLRWLAETQKAAASEVHRVGKLERTEAALQARLRETAEEKAALQSARMDLGDAGRAMREAIASQSDIYVKRVGGLEEARRTTDGDRTKLIQECAELQAKLTRLAPQLSSMDELEARHSKLARERQSLADESQRLRDVNEALGAQLLGGGAGQGDDAGMATIGDSLRRVLQLHRRFVERQVAQSEERQKFAERIRALEREAAQASFADAGRPAASSSAARRPAPRAPPGGGGGGGGALIASTTTALRRGLGKLGDWT